MESLFKLDGAKRLALMEIINIVHGLHTEYAKGGNLRNASQYSHDAVEQGNFNRQCDSLERVYGESYHVLCSIFHHNRKTTNEDHPWANEFEIPIDIYKHGINTAIHTITNYRGVLGTTYAADYDILLQLLNELLAFRRENS